MTSNNIKNSLGSDRVNRQITGSLENLNGSTNYQVSLISNEQKILFKTQKVTLVF